MTTPKYTKQGLINLNYLAQRVAGLEGKKEQVDIAQISEVQARILDVLATEFGGMDALNMLKERRNKLIKA